MSKSIKLRENSGVDISLKNLLPLESGHILVLLKPLTYTQQNLN